MAVAMKKLPVLAAMVHLPALVGTTLLGMEHIALMLVIFALLATHTSITYVLLLK